MANNTLVPETRPDEIMTMDYLHADLDDIIFRNKNKNYGAYFLRKHYAKYMSLSNILATALFVIGMNMPNIIKAFKEKMPIEDTFMASEVLLSEPPPLDPAAPPPPPPPPVELPVLRKATIAFVAPKVKKDEEVTEEVMPPDVDELKDLEISTKTQEGSENGIAEGILDDGPAYEAPPPPVVEEEKPVKEAAPFKIVEQMPSYPDGEAAMMKFIYENTTYPAIARDNGVEGTVYATFVVERDGSITDVKILRDIGGGCGDEAKRVVQLMPKWIPGKQRGRPVRVQFTLPIKFSLKH